VLKREWTNEYACHTHVTMSMKCCFPNLLIQWELGDTGKVVIGGVCIYCQKAREERKCCWQFIKCKIDVFSRTVDFIINFGEEGLW